MKKFFAFIVIILLLFSLACSYDKDQALSINDATLYKLSSADVGFQFFKRSTDTLVADVESPHGSYVRIRFNELAAGALNSDLSGLIAGKFPDGSLVVKEIYDAPGGVLKVYAVMFKSSVEANSGAGWIWAEYGPSGDVIYSAVKKGVDCTSCHSDTGNEDLVRTFSLH